MNDKQIRLAVGSMLHDIGKIVYRSGDGRNHSQSGYDYLGNQAGVSDQEILDCVRYHHGYFLKHSGVRNDSLAYLTYFADNISSAADRRKKEDMEDGFDKSVPLSSVFNILNGNAKDMHYQQKMLTMQDPPNMPTNEKAVLDESFYQSIILKITECLKGISLSEDYLNSLLTILEATTSYIPSSTSRRELADISLYDHLKLTAAIAACLEQVTATEGISDYKDIFMDHADTAYEKKWFLLYSMDVSGIQRFIYMITSSGALRGLRARSFYLEFMMEHIIDELLFRTNLSRANLIYMGGGHCYLLLPNTDEVKAAASEWHLEINNWLMKSFGTSLYVAAGYTEANALNLQNQPEGSYADLFRNMSRMISAEKAHRYSPADLIALNHIKTDGERECKICHRMGNVNEDGKCELCAVIEATSTDVLYKDYFVVLKSEDRQYLPLPGGCIARAVSEEQLKQLMRDDKYVRSYTKNELFTGYHVTTKLLVGNYSARKTFEDFAKEAKGIKRLAVLRADVDNLGTAFVSGFAPEYASLSRTATFSRQLSLFFKGSINYILEHGKSHSFSNGGARNVSIVYSGGDDVFLVGSWNEVIDAFIDIRNELAVFTEGMLSLSGGIGLYPGKYPIHLMASETEQLESAAKHVDGKDAITVFEPDGAFSWKAFLDDVIGEKYQALLDFFRQNDERGMAFLYHLLELLRDQGERIRFARYIYLLSRMEPDSDHSKEEKEAYKVFMKKMAEWYQNPTDRKSLITAIYLYVYTVRQGD